MKKRELILLEFLETPVILSDIPNHIFFSELQVYSYMHTQLSI